jgi:hypothetical protein
VEEKQAQPTPPIVADEVVNAMNLPSREEIQAHAQAQGIPLQMSPEESALRRAMAQNGVEDIRTHVPIPRNAPPQADAMEMDARIHHNGSDSDSDLSVTPAFASM